MPNGDSPIIEIEFDIREMAFIGESMQGFLNALPENTPPELVSLILGIEQKCQAACQEVEGMIRTQAEQN